MKNMNLKTMLSAIGLLAVAAPSTLSVVACGAKPIVEGDKTNLTNVIKVRLVDGKDVNTADAVLTKIGELNPNLVLGDVEIGSFKAAKKGVPGSAEVVAKPNTQYTGVVSITITALGQIDLRDVVAITTIDGEIANTEATVLAKVGELNPNLVLGDVEIGSFKAAKKGVPGSAEVVAKPNTQYKGRARLTISLIRIDLHDVIKNTEVQGNIANTENAVLVEVAKLNSGLQVAYVEIEGFEAATETANGSAKIVAKPNMQYIGEVKIIITRILSEKEQRLKKLKEIPRDNLGMEYPRSEWYNAWNGYFNAVRTEIMNTTFEFTSKEASDDDLIKDVLVSILRKTVTTDLLEWEIPKEYDLNSLSLYYFRLKKENQMINIEASLSLDLKYNDNGVMKDYPFRKSYNLDINYKVID